MILITYIKKYQLFNKKFYKIYPYINYYYDKYYEIMLYILAQLYLSDYVYNINVHKIDILYTYNRYLIIINDKFHIGLYISYCSLYIYTDILYIKYLDDMKFIYNNIDHSINQIIKQLY